MFNGTVEKSPESSDILNVCLEPLVEINYLAKTHDLDQKTEKIIANLSNFSVLTEQPQIGQHKCDKFCPSSHNSTISDNTSLVGCIASDTKPICCPQCGKSFKIKQSLYAHAKVHDNAKRFQCELCSKAFKLKQQLQNHQKVHLDEKPFHCEQCAKCFKFKQQLQKHQLVHSGIKEFQCKFCAKAFMFKQQLQVHAKIHLEVKEFCCELCAKTFRTKQQLQVHMKVHYK